MTIVIDHVALPCDDLAASVAFYDAVLAPLGGARLFDYDDTIGYGTVGPDGPRPEFWIGLAGAEGVAKEAHIAFHAPSRAAVDAFFAAAVRLGAYVRDPDGNNVEAVCHRPV
jgi:catechol 2,3-dioxygenase-like lactoylglutathione lyase family enzyme